VTDEEATAAARAVRARIRSAHGDLLAGVAAAADGVLAPGAATSTRPADALERGLERAELLARAAGAIPDLLDAAGLAGRGDPVPAPPYVVVTGEGLVCRATVDGGRLVVAFRAFELERDPPAGAASGPAYRRLADGGVAVDVEFVRS
jgi:hypothetical protein